MIAVLAIVATPPARCEEVVEAEKIASILHGYAENDYTQRRPLLDAWELGFRHIEADTFLLDDRLMIGNSVLDLQSKGSLESLYLMPLDKLFKDRGDSQIGVDTQLNLIIEIKSDGQLTYRALRKTLAKYSSMLTKVVDGQAQQGLVTVIISGNCPREIIESENPRYVAIDGRLSDLDSNSPTHLIPMISARWGSHFRWLGRSKMSNTEQLHLQSIVERAHAGHRMIRFWSTPDVEAVWTRLRLARVDLIGAEQYPKLCDFLAPRRSP